MPLRSTNSCPIEWEMLLELSECQTEQSAALRSHLETCAECRARQKRLHQMLTVLHSPVLDHAPPEAIRRAQNLFHKRMTPLSALDPALETA